MNRETKVIALAIVAVIVAIFTFTLPVEKKDSTYTVTFIDDKAVYNTIEDVKKDSVVDPVDPPTKAGYVFKGWYQDGELYDFDTPIKDNIFLEAKWEKASTLPAKEASEITTKEECTKYKYHWWVAKSVCLDNKKAKDIKDEDECKEFGYTWSSDQKVCSSSSKDKTDKDSKSSSDDKTSSKTDSKSSDSKTDSKTSQNGKTNTSTNSTKKDYTITVINGTGSGTYKEGTVVTISANVPAETISGWTGNTAEAADNVRYKNKTTYSFKRWNDGNTSQTRKVTVTGNATYTAEFNSTVTQVNKQKYVKEGEYIYGYPTAINFDVTVSSMIAAGQISQGCFSAIVKSGNPVSSCKGADPGSGPLTSYTGTFKWSSANWNITYNWTTGVATLTSKKSFSSTKVIAFSIEYSTDETKGIVKVPTSLGIQSCDPGSGNCFAGETDIKETHKNAKSPGTMTITLDKVIVGRKYTWKDI